MKVKNPSLSAGGGRGNYSDTPKVVAALEPTIMFQFEIKIFKMMRVNSSRLNSL